MLCSIQSAHRHGKKRFYSRLPSSVLSIESVCICLLWYFTTTENEAEQTARLEIRTQQCRAAGETDRTAVARTLVH
jgi:hypothetical protein